jgi:hypothetical protein
MFIIEKSNCNCNSTILNFQGKCINKWFDYDSQNSILKCTNNYIKKFTENELHTNCLMYCPLECDSNELLITSNNQIFPISGIIGNKTKKELFFKYDNYEEIKKKIIRVFAYYDDFKYNYISQKPKTEPFSFISDIGGIFSLFLGISLISVFEIFEVIYDLVYVLVSIKV